MRQTRLDESKKEDLQEAAAGSKRKEPASETDATSSTQEDRTKSRKTERSEKEQSQEDEKTQQNGGKNGASSPAKLSGDQRKVDNKLKGDDVEINEGASEDKEEVPWHVTEKGLVYFFYRPKVVSSDKAESNSTESLDDVQNTSMLLVPRASESDTAPASEASGGKSSSTDGQGDKRKPPNPTAYRLVSLGKKRMPSPEAALKSGQEPGGIGGRHSEAIWATPAARPAGRGHYALSIKTTDPPSSREVRLTYHLSHPSSDDFGQVQEELGLHSASSVLVQMRNPTLAPTGPGAPAAGLPEDQRAILTKDELEQNFGGDVKKGNRYARPEEPALLDRKGVELLLIKREQQEDDGLTGLGDEQSEALSKLAQQDSDKLSDEAILKELELSSKEIEVEALSGEWI
ncbi:conserved hypothetical protein [Sporisorium reilianum SRZ2]|uniref:Uncharacterized protein n=1 Tax=Sporisorium reilianum (strain SRZ2) TaxID=999809 RepID=E6ZKC4_SPORE|nr:conserved hypothetical protein [Sporisorium reilianum SRZ2]